MAEASVIYLKQHGLKTTIGSGTHQINQSQTDYHIDAKEDFMKIESNYNMHHHHVEG